MNDITVTTFHADGSFTTQPAPEWLLSLHKLQEDDFETAFEKVFKNPPLWTETITSDGYDYGEAKAFETPDGGVFVTIWNENNGTEFYLPDAAQWWPFHINYVEPFLANRSQVLLNESLQTIANAIIAFARHGHGEHISENDGVSRIDRQRAWEEFQARKAAP